jgi:hypothetical protein
MKIVTPPLNVKTEDGFSSDILERKSFGEALSNLVERSDEELVR